MGKLDSLLQQILLLNLNQLSLLRKPTPKKENKKVISRPEGKDFMLQHTHIHSYFLT